MPGILLTPPYVRVSTRWFNEDEQALPLMSSCLKTPWAASRAIVCATPLAMVFDMCKELYGSYRVESLAYAGPQFEEVSDTVASV